MSASWSRETTLIDPTAIGDADRQAIERRAAERGIDWSPTTARPATRTIAWRTESTTEVGRIRKRTRTVTTTGVIDDAADIIAWAINDDGAPPAAVVVRRSRVDVADAMVGIPAHLAGRAAEIGADGVTVRGDLGGRELGSIFLPLGTGPEADRVRAALKG